MFGSGCDGEVDGSSAITHRVFVVARHVAAPLLDAAVAALEALRCL